MSIIQISKIQVRTGNLVDLPQLSAGELGWADDERRLFIGNDSNRVGDPDPNNTEILTKYSPLEISGNITIANVSNLSIGGGNNGYFLQTNGNGILVWSAIPGGSTTNVAGSNTQIQFNTAGGFDASANLVYLKSNNILRVSGKIESSNLTVNVNSEFSNALFNGNVQFANTAQNTIVVGNLANLGNYVTIGSGQIFATRLNASQANISANLTANTITANQLLRAANTLIINDGTWSNLSGELIVANYNVRANGNGIFTTGYVNAVGSMVGENFTGNALTINVSANINNVLIANSSIVAANITSNGVITGNGSRLSAINASNISSGIIPSARLSGSYGIDVNNANTAIFVTANAQPNITSVGILSSLSAGEISTTGNLLAANIVANAANITGNLRVQGSGNILGNLNVGQNINAQNATFANTVTATTFIGNFATPSIIQGNSNIIIYSNGFIGFTSNGQADILTIQSNGTTGTSTFANNVTVAGSLTAGSLNGPLSNGTSNITIGNSSNIVLRVGGFNIANFTVNEANIFGSLNVSSNITTPNFVGALANGNSNVNIPVINGNVNISALGTPNVVVVSNTGVGINGTLSVAGNLSAANINGGNLITANYIKVDYNLLTESLNSTGNVTANYFIGNGIQLSGISGPLFRAYNSLQQTLLAGLTFLNYSTATDNIGSFYNTTTGVFTPLTPGYYQINASILPQLLVGTANGSFSLVLYKNASIISQGTTVAVTPTWGIIGYSNLSTLVYLNGINDSVRIGVLSNITSGTWASSTSPLNYFQAAWQRG